LTHRDLEMVAFRCEVEGLRRSVDVRWARRTDLEALGIPSAMRALLVQV
jgi:hypothetical protein